MKSSELVRWLSKRGVLFAKAGKGSHRKAYLGDRMTVVPFHPGKEIGSGLVEKIKKDLGIR